MTIDEAIIHAENVAQQQKCIACADEHRQLAEWLREFKQLRSDKALINDRKTNIYDFIEWLITYGHPIISILRTVKFNNDELQDCYDYSIFSLEKAIETKDKDIVCANLVDSLYEFSKILKQQES